MAWKNFLKDNFVLVVGLTLPILLIVGFMVASSLPFRLEDPPKYDLIFSTKEYPGVSNGSPINVVLVVKDGILKAQYTKTNPTSPEHYNHEWLKLYIYQAKTQNVRELTFGLPPDADKIISMREDTVEAAKQLKLDTTLQSPDGYQLTYDGYDRGGLVNNLFWGSGRYANELRLKKGSSSLPLSIGEGHPYFYYGNVQFVGWVIGTN